VKDFLINGDSEMEAQLLTIIPFRAQVEEIRALPGQRGKAMELEEK
jgi:hypothetical protein